MTDTQDDLSIPSHNEALGGLQTLRDSTRPPQTGPFQAIPMDGTPNTYLLLDHWTSSLSNISWRLRHCHRRFLEHPDEEGPLPPAGTANDRPFGTLHYNHWVHVRIQNRAYYTDKTMLLGTCMEKESLRTLCSPMSLGRDCQLTLAITNEWLSIVIIVDLEGFVPQRNTPLLIPRSYHINYSVSGDLYILRHPGILAEILPLLSVRPSNLFTFEGSQHRCVTTALRTCSADQSRLLLTSRMAEYRYWPIYVGSQNGLHSSTPLVDRAVSLGRRPDDIYDSSILPPVLCVHLPRSWPTTGVIVLSQEYAFPLLDCLFRILAIAVGDFETYAVTPISLMHDAGRPLPMNDTNTLPRHAWGLPTSPLPSLALPQESCLSHIRVHTTRQYLDRLAPLHMILHDWTFSDLIRPLPIQNNARCVVIIGTPWLSIIILVVLDNWSITPSGNLMRDITSQGRYQRTCGSFLLMTRGFLYELLDGMRVVTVHPAHCLPQAHRCHTFTLHPHDHYGNIQVRSWTGGHDDDPFASWRIYPRHITAVRPPEVTYE